jgi:hypothetical protein
MADEFEKYNLVNSVVSPDEVFDAIGATLDKDAGTHFVYTCPYHTDDLPSLNINKSTGDFNCFGCDNKGRGAYGAARHYLFKTDGHKPSPLSIITFLSEINPRVEQFRYLFSVRVQREYDHDQDKRKIFGQRSKIINPMDVLFARHKNWTPEQSAIYIDGIMHNMPDELLLQLIDKKKHKEMFEESNEFLSLLND